MRKKTVLHIFSGDLWAGAEVMAFNLLNRLKDDPELEIIALSLNEGILSDKLRNNGIETLVIPENKYVFISICCRAILQLRGRKIDTIHSHRYKENVLGYILSKMLGVRQLITTIHGMPETNGNADKDSNRQLRISTRINFYLLNKGFTGVVAVSQNMKEALIHQYNFGLDKISVIHNGIPSADDSRYAISQDTGDASKKSFIHVGVVGRMVPVKDYELFLETAAEVIRRNNKVRFSILGEGPLKSDLLKKIQDLRLESFVELLQPRPDPSQYYRSLDIYMNTSVHEGIPLSILEAMSFGKPIVAPLVGGIPEIIASGENGFLSAVRERKAFADSCLMLINNERLRTTIGNKNREKIREHFSDLAMCERYKSVYLSGIA